MRTGLCIGTHVAGAQKHKGHLAVAFVFLGCLVEVAGIEPASVSIPPSVLHA